MAEPTARQLEVLRHLGVPLASGRRAPTYRQPLVLLGLRSTNGVRAHLDALARKGLLERDGGQLLITSAGWRALGLRKPTPVPLERT